MSEKIQIWGYSDDGKAQIFELGKGEKLPAGWHSAPKPWHHPNHPDFGKAKPSKPSEPPTVDDDDSTGKPVRKKK